MVVELLTPLLRLLTQPAASPPFVRVQSSAGAPPHRRPLPSPSGRDGAAACCSGSSSPARGGGGAAAADKRRSSFGELMRGSSMAGRLSQVQAGEDGEEEAEGWGDWEEEAEGSGEIEGPPEQRALLKALVTERTPAGYHLPVQPRPAPGPGPQAPPEPSAPRRQQPAPLRRRRRCRGAGGASALQSLRREAGEREEPGGRDRAAPRGRGRAPPGRRAGGTPPRHRLGQSAAHWKPPALAPGCVRSGDGPLCTARCASCCCATRTCS